MALIFMDYLCCDGRDWYECKYNCDIHVLFVLRRHGGSMKM